MKKNRQLQKIIYKLVDNSFTKSGSLDQKKTSSYLNFLQALPNTKQLEALVLFKKGLRRKLFETTLIVSSGVFLPETTKKQIIQKAKKDYLIKDTEFKIDPSLLGGLVVKIGDVLINASLKSRVAQLAQVIKGG